jgi:uncharacterized protein
MPTDKPLALITGASAGLGATFARRLARDSCRFILVARRRDRLEALARELGGAEVIAADLASDEGVKLVEDRIAAAGDLDLLINNAGFGTSGRFFEAPLEGQDTMHRLHVMATMRLAHAALGGMTARGRGAIINVASVAGFAVTPGSISYCSTKAWMIAFTEGLWLDLKTARSPVRVQALCPGFTITEFHDAMGMSRDRIPGWLWTRAEDVVEASLRGLARDKLVVVPGGIYKTLVFLEAWTPRWLRHVGAIRYARAAGRRTDRV